MIHVENLTKSFRDLRRGQVLAVDGVSFDAVPGKVFGLLGPNGAGKTTIMRILCTVLKPTGGIATLAGYDVFTHPEKVRQHIGFLSANTAIYDRMSAWEMVEYFAKLYGLAGDNLRQRMETVFTSLQMNDFRDVLGARMSTGMRQKVSIARAIVHDPPVMIFDEPTLGLDVMAARAIVRFVRDCRERGKTVIYSTHVMSEAEKLCDRVGIIHAGSIRAEGTVAELKARTGERDLEEAFVRIVAPEAAP
jgi:sodium transport system ATP-binding protein